MICRVIMKMVFSAWKNSLISMHEWSCIHEDVACNHIYHSICKAAIHLHIHCLSSTTPLFQSMFQVVVITFNAQFGPQPPLLPYLNSAMVAAGGAVIVSGGRETLILNSLSFISPFDSSITTHLVLFCVPSLPLCPFPRLISLPFACFISLPFPCQHSLVLSPLFPFSYLFFPL